MNGNMPAGPAHLHHPPTFTPQQQQHHQSRRQNEYHHPQYHPQHFSPYQYPPNSQQHYYGAPQHPHFMPQWYPYQHFPAQPPQPHARHFQPQPTLAMSPHPHAQPAHPVPRAIQHTPQLPQYSPTPLPEHSTTSTLSHTIASPSTTPTSTSVQTTTPPIPTPSAKPPTSILSASPSVQESTTRSPYQPPLPWYSVPDEPFPPKSSRRRRRRKLSELPSDAPQFPSRLSGKVDQGDVGEDKEPEGTEVSSLPIVTERIDDARAFDIEPPVAELIDTSAVEGATSPSGAAASVQRSRALTRPVVPIIPNFARRSTHQSSTQELTVPAKIGADGESSVVAASEVKEDADAPSVAENSMADAPSAKLPPASWAGLFSRGKPVAVNGSGPIPVAVGGTVNGIRTSQSETLADALRQYGVEKYTRALFLEPRGLVNTGNMCYMNSILQVLVFCVPFYEFLDQVSKRAVHSFKSTTPLVEAMIMFMREYQVIDSASSTDQLRMRLKDSELEQYGEPFIPEYVYEAIKRLPRFSSMRRGQQQDAEEFLGLLLEVLHVECASVMISDDPIPSSGASDVTSEKSIDGSSSTADVGGWMEVGYKQKPSVTRSSGSDVESPVTKIFGGKLRSEFRVSGNKNSVTLTPYQQLQLDIGDQSVSNVVDALKGLTRSERVDGTFQTPRGPQDYGTKQFFIETLPPVLILHLKRFHFEGNTTQKIWKKIGYPLELEIPKEVFAHNKRGQYTSRPQGLPKYRLIGVVYHHGKNASGGHYTVDVRRQEGREWIRLDDTVIRRIRAEDVASEGGEEDPQVLAKALEQHKQDEQVAKQNIFNQAGFADEGDEQTDNGEGGKGWSQINGTMGSPTGQVKKWSGVGVNGGSGASSNTGKRTPREAASASKTSAKDNKVAYILFYEQIRT